MNGILNVIKPAGITSYGVVARVRRLTGVRRVGHAGTLDPAATGVLPVCLGQGTRVVEFLAEDAKRYRAGIELGVSTDTYDAEGVVTARHDPSGIGREKVDAALGPFRGAIQQVPPVYSALKLRGRPLYQLAREGIAVEPAGRPVNIYSLEVVGWQPPVVTLDVACSKGTYIRSLANDLGAALGCGAHLSSLIRMSYGIFDITDGVTLPEFEEAVRRGDWQRYLRPIDSVLRGMRPVTVNDGTAEEIRNGRPVELGAGEAADIVHSREGGGPGWAASGPLCRAYALDGRLLAVLRREEGQILWRPYKVFDARGHGAPDPAVSNGSLEEA